jgi:hypothetical protein
MLGRWRPGSHCHEELGVAVDHRVAKGESMSASTLPERDDMGDVVPAAAAITF